MYSRYSHPFLSLTCTSWSRFNVRMLSSQCRNFRYKDKMVNLPSCYKDKTVSWPPYLYNGIHIGKTVFILKQSPRPYLPIFVRSILHLGFFQWQYRIPVKIEFHSAISPHGFYLLLTIQGHPVSSNHTVVGVQGQFLPFCGFHNLSSSAKHTTNFEYHVYIWPVSP